VSSAARLAALLLAALLAVGVGGEVALADDGAHARDYFDRAVVALHEGRYAEARDLLDSSLTLAARAPTAFNLVVALRGTGEVVRATTVCEQLLSGRYEPLRSDQEEEARRVCEAVQAEVAVLRVEIEGPADAVVRIDGQPARSLGPSHRVDPGEHVVVTTARRHDPAEARVTVGRGETRAVHLTLTPTASSDLGWWLAGGAAAAVVAVVVVVLLVVTRPDPERPPPQSDPVFGIAQALTLGADPSR
jgi:hypothetical protein